MNNINSDSFRLMDERKCEKMIEFGIYDKQLINRLKQLDLISLNNHSINGNNQNVFITSDEDKEFRKPKTWHRFKINTQNKSEMIESNEEKRYENKDLNNSQLIDVKSDGNSGDYDIKSIGGNNKNIFITGTSYEDKEFRKPKTWHKFKINTQNKNKTIESNVEKKDIKNIEELEVKSNYSSSDYDINSIDGNNKNISITGTLDEVKEFRKPKTSHKFKIKAQNKSEMIESNEEKRYENKDLNNIQVIDVKSDGNSGYYDFGLRHPNDSRFVKPLRRPKTLFYYN